MKLHRSVTQSVCSLWNLNVVLIQNLSKGPFRCFYIERVLKTFEPLCHSSNTFLVEDSYSTSWSWSLIVEMIRFDVKKSPGASLHRRNTSVELFWPVPLWIHLRKHFCRRFAIILAVCWKSKSSTGERRGLCAACPDEKLVSEKRREKRRARRKRSPKKASTREISSLSFSLLPPFPSLFNFVLTS